MTASKLRRRLSVKEIAVFSMLGAMMYLSKILMEWLPNVHFLGMFTVTFTAVYRKRALIPIYVYVFLNGIFAGFDLWWLPYTYIWTLLWAMVMVLPKNMKPAVAAVAYALVCSLHGFLFGTLYAPAQALMFGLGFKATIAWIIAGLPWDIIHGIGNLVMGGLVLPLSLLLRRLNRQIGIAA